MPRIASRRLIWPSRMLSQVGVEESSKSAMNTLAPEFSALMTILRSTGPVISTRRSSRSCGIGATVHAPSRTAWVSGRKSGLLTRREVALPFDSSRQQCGAGGSEAALQCGKECEGVRRQGLAIGRRKPERQFLKDCLFWSEDMESLIHSTILLKLRGH